MTPNRRAARGAKNALSRKAKRGGIRAAPAKAATRGKRGARSTQRSRSTRGLVAGRFTGSVHPALDAINRSFDVDQRLWPEDILASAVHARMLGKVGILTPATARRIVEGLRRVAAEFAEGRFKQEAGDEDIHMAVERRLTALIGEDGKRLHTARSRNDQVATDLRMYLGAAAAGLADGVRGVQAALVALARRDGDALLPYYTHMQRAQPVLLGHVLLAYVELLEQDRRGLRYDAEECPLGAGAGTGTSFPIDPAFTAQGLGFLRPSPNSLEAVASRRDATMLVAGMAACATTLSRLGADLVLWSSREFGFVRLGDAVSTGSSIMPQKRNPDGAELLRAKAARVNGALLRLLELQRGLPLGYHKDLQEDKAALFEAEQTLAQMLAVATAMLGDLEFDRAAMRAAVTAPGGYLLATEAADWLVRRGVSFREAHHAVGQLVRTAEQRGVALEALPLDDFRAAHKSFDKTVYRALTPEAAVAARKSVGGTAPGNVARQIRRWETLLAGEPQPLTPRV